MDLGDEKKPIPLLLEVVFLQISFSSLSLPRFQNMPLSTAARSRAASDAPQQNNTTSR